MSVKGTYPESNAGNFKVVGTLVSPHPIGIDSAFIVAQNEGTAPKCFICKRRVREGLQDKVLSVGEHVEDILLIEGKVEINPMPDELKEYLLEIKEEAAKNGYAKFGFQRYSPKPVLRTWPNYMDKKPPTYRLGTPGEGCAGDPPNHPRYFVQPIYTQYGNSPPRPPYHVYNGTGYEDLDQLDALYKPLPIKHPRVQAWIADTFRHHAHCYQDPTISGDWSKKIIIYPVPDSELKYFHDDPRFSEAWRAREKESIGLTNAEILKHAREVATPSNHDATILVREYYPKFKPTVALVENPPTRVGNWWSTMEKQPTPEECPGQYGTPHPVNGGWCQWCGWSSDEKE